jgi:hypothetical protein
MKKNYVRHPLRNARHANLMTSPLFPSLACNFEIDRPTLKLARLVIKKKRLTIIFETEAGH